ncbi:MAG TPA: toxic anion resistance protein [Geminicoccaceae bacterium]|nr:toxic anion resistance protein [Geminicoccus sp.]HMU48295.1 toxic anion resistance protein [Geminicoccaceae bacterium]
MSASESPSSITAAVAADDLAVGRDGLHGELSADIAAEPRGDVAARVATAMAELDPSDSQSIIFFGSKAQQQLTTVSDSMLESVRAKDVGPAGDALGRMVRKLRELDFTAIDPTDRPGFLGRLFGVKSEVMKYLDQYQDVRDQIDHITGELEQHKTRLLTDIVRLDKLYDATLGYFRTLEVYIAAGRAKLAELDETTIPELAGRADRSGDVVEAQGLRDLRGARDDLERRVHDLLLTRQVTMQSLPGIRLVQENDKSLVTKINSTIANTVPLWRQQLAQAITVFRAGQAADSVKAASDLTNDLLRGNAERLQQVNAKVREQVERGVFDLDAVRQTNERLIATIQDSLRIADEGKARRAAAETQLLALEDQLKKTLVSASSHARPA